MWLKNSGSSLLDCMISLAIMSVGMLGLAQLNLQQLKRLTFANEQLLALSAASDAAAIHSAYKSSGTDIAMFFPSSIQITNIKEERALLVNWVSVHGEAHEITLPLP